MAAIQSPDCARFVRVMPRINHVTFADPETLKHEIWRSITAGFARIGIEP